MKRNVFYGALLVLLLGFLVRENRLIHIPKQVEKTEESAEWQPEWYEQMAEEINDSPITLEVDGTMVDPQLGSLRMSQDGQFMIPYGMLPEALSCAALLYDGNRLVMERGNTHAEMTVGSPELLLGEESQTIAAPPEWENGILYVPLEAVTEVFSYEENWDAENRKMELTGSEDPATFLPESYDYRKAGRAPAVKNQGSLGTCWAFASVMALESRVRPEWNVSFSEDHMSLRNSFHFSQNAGGEYTMSMAYLLAWQGPVLEEEDPYGDGYSPDGLSPACHVQEIQVLPEKDYEAVKRAVYLYGGVQSSLYTAMVSDRDDTHYYRKETGAYWYNGDEKPNHDVVIIGWDDHYSRDNFNQPPEGDGAFICANSWGGEFGDDGYFYVSYYDTNIGIHNILYSGIESADNYDHIYQTDLCGWVGQLGYGKESAFFANIYTAEEKEELEAVGFYATGENTSYQVYTVTDAEGSSQFGRRRKVASGEVANAGYYTVLLDKTMTLEAGERFAVIVEITTPGAIHPVAIEYSSPDKGLTVDLSDGEGYISYRGSSWERVEAEQNCNVCLKAYTRNVDSWN